MNRKLILLVLLLSSCLALSACRCKHENWNEAKCEIPATCVKCGQAVGAPLEHNWLEATCERAKTCEFCGKTEGTVAGHSWMEANCQRAKTCEVCGMTEGSVADHTWEEANCENARTCKVCSKTEGEPLGHVWLDATTEAPKTCQICAATEGERIITDPRFTTAATAAIQGTWSFSHNMSGEMMGMPDFEKGIDTIMYFEFRNDGSATIYGGYADPEAAKKDLAEYAVSLMYAEYAAAGYDKAAADEAFYASQNKTIEEHVYGIISQEIDLMFEDTFAELVYYVKDSELYLGGSWSDTMSANPFTLEGDVLSFEGDVPVLGMKDEKLYFTRVVKE